jgi:hypothetical protein
VPYNLRAALRDTTLPGRPGQPDIAVLEGDVVVYSTLAMQRRRDLYPERGADGKEFADPGVFCPERWDGWTPRAWTYVPFNGGPRICVGQNFAMTEMAFTREFLSVKELGSVVYGWLTFRGWQLFGCCRSMSGWSIAGTGMRSSIRLRLWALRGMACLLPSLRLRTVRLRENGGDICVAFQFRAVKYKMPEVGVVDLVWPTLDLRGLFPAENLQFFDLNELLTNTVLEDQLGWK